MPKPDAIQPVSAGLRLKMLVYADPGVGKTVLAGSSDKPTLIIRPPMDHTDSLAVRGSSAEEWEVDNWNEMEEAYEYLRHGGQDDYHWVWLDSISIFQDAGLDDVYEDMLARKKAGPERELRAQYGPDKGEYGVNMHRLAKWVRHMAALDVHFGITAHPFRTVDPSSAEDGGMIYMPWIQGKQMPEKICGYMNMVGYLKPHVKDDKTHRVLLVNHTGTYYAKDQLDAFPNGRMVDPTLPKIEKAIEKARSKAKNTKRKGGKQKQTESKTEDVSWDDV